MRLPRIPVRSTPMILLFSDPSISFLPSLFLLCPIPQSIPLNTAKGFGGALLAPLSEGKRHFAATRQLADAFLVYLESRERVWWLQQYCRPVSVKQYLRTEANVVLNVLYVTV